MITGAEVPALCSQSEYRTLDLLTAQMNDVFWLQAAQIIIHNKDLRTVAELYVIPAR